jgi:hypothetical protein
MKNDDILSEIAYLDDDAAPRQPAPSHADLANITELRELVRAAMQVELARAAHWQNAEDLYARVASLESRFEGMMRVVARQQRMPSVQYIVAVPGRGWSVSPADRPIPIPKPPAAMSVFYSLGLACTIIFAILLAMSSMGLNLIHPFLSLLGLTGSLGWLTTAWTDLLLWKRERPLGKGTEARNNQDLTIAV